MSNRYVYSPMPDQSLGIMRSMNPFDPVSHPVVDPLIPSDYLDPVVNMGPYGVAPAIAPLQNRGMGSVQDAMAVLSVTDLLFGN